MAEKMNKYGAISVDVSRLQAPSTVRERAIQQMLEQLRTWGVSLPPSDPLVLDFGLADFARIGLIESWIANELAAGYCGKYLYLSDGQRCPDHSHRDKHETFFIVKGRVQVQFNGKPLLLPAGSSLPIAPGNVHSFGGEGPALILELSTPCLPADNYFTDPKVDAWLRSVT